MAGMDTTLLALSGIGLKYDKVNPIFWPPCAEASICEEILNLLPSYANAGLLDHLGEYCCVNMRVTFNA